MKGMVVCPEPLAAEAGAWALKRGGNAIDAALAGAFAQGVVDPVMCGLGGHGRIFIHDGKSGETVFVDFMGHCGSKAIPGVYESLEERTTEKVLRAHEVKNDENGIGYKAFIVPAFAAGAEEAHRRFCRLPWAELLTPAIRLAEDGFRVYPFLRRTGYVAYNENSFQHFARNKASADIYTKNGRPYQVGELLVQKDYARTLKRIAENGAEIFYRGEIAEEMGRDFEKNGALVTLEDLKDFRPRSTKAPWISKPLITTYGEYEICCDQPPGSGSMKLETLNILENFELRKLGWNTPEYLNILSQAIQLAMIDREKYVRDPLFYPEVISDTAAMISKEHALKQKDNIIPGRGAASSGFEDINFEADGTTHISVADGDGNAAACTHSIATSSGVSTPGLGFMYTSHMKHYDPRSGNRLSIAPGKAPTTSPSPTMIFKKGELFMITGSPWGPFGATAEIQAFLNVAEFGMGMQQAVSMPRIHCDIFKREIIVESNFPCPYPQEGLKKMGNKILVNDLTTGKLAAIRIDPHDRTMDGGTDPRGAGGLAYVD